MMNKIMGNTYYGPDTEIKRYPKANADRKQKCGYACWCGTCRHMISASYDYPGGHPMRCMYKLREEG